MIHECSVSDYLTSCNRNRRFRMDNCLCINIIRIFMGFFSNLLSIHSLFNFIICIIQLFCNFFNIKNRLFIHPIIIFRILFQYIFCNNNFISWFIYIYSWIRFIVEGFSLEEFINTNRFNFWVANPMKCYIFIFNIKLKWRPEKGVIFRSNHFGSTHSRLIQRIRKIQSFQLFLSFIRFYLISSQFFVLPFQIFSYPQ